MKIELDITRLIKEEITPNEVIFLYIISNNFNVSLPLKVDIYSLEQRGWVKLNLDENNVLQSIELNQKALNILKKTDLDCESWIEEWRNLFPPKVKSGGYLVRGDKNGVLKKMKNFIKNNPEFTKDIIFKATENYIKSKKKDGYNYMKLAHYFIEKDNVSELASLCEQLINSTNEENDDINKTKKGKDNWE